MHADDRLPRYQQVRDELVALIAAHHWRPGEAIPTEQALAKQYDVAVGTVRKAVDLLVAEGLLERFQGRGTFVRRASFDSSLFRFFRFQTRQGERRIPESRILRREVVEAPSAVAATLQIPNGSKAIQMSRLRLIDDVPRALRSVATWSMLTPSSITFGEVRKKLIGFAGRSGSDVWQAARRQGKC